MPTARIYAFLAFVCISMQLTPARGAVAWENATCTWLFEDASQSRPDMKDAMQLGGGASIQICNFFSADEETYFAVRKIHEGPHGVCQYALDQIFREEEKDEAGQTWSFLPPAGWPYDPAYEIFMALPEGECPRQDDDSYVVADNVSEGVFHAFASFWRDARHDIRAFEEASSGMPEADRSSDSFRRFRELLLSDSAATDGGNNPIKLSSVSLANQLVTLGGVFYDASFREPGRNSESWRVTFDVTPYGVRIYQVAHAVE